MATGQVTMDVNQCPTLEADIAFQQITANFAGKPYKKAACVNFIPFYKETLDMNKMVPWIRDDYMKKRAAGAFKYDSNDAVFRENPDNK